MRLGAAPRYRLSDLGLGNPTWAFRKKLDWINENVPSHDRRSAQVAVLAQTEFGRSLLPISVRQASTHNIQREAIEAIGLDVFLARGDTAEFPLRDLAGWNPDLQFKHKLALIDADPNLSGPQRQDAKITLAARSTLGRQVLKTRVLPGPLKRADPALIMLSYFGVAKMLRIVRTEPPYPLEGLPGWARAKGQILNRVSVIRRSGLSPRERDRAIATALARTQSGKEALAGKVKGAQPAQTSDLDDDQALTTLDNNGPDFTLAAAHEVADCPEAGPVPDDEPDWLGVRISTSPNMDVWGFSLVQVIVSCGVINASFMCSDQW